MKGTVTANMHRMDRKDPFDHFDICTRLFNTVKTFSARILGQISLAWKALLQKVTAYGLRSDDQLSEGLNPAHGRRDPKAGSRGAPVSSLSNVPSRDGEDVPDHSKKALLVDTAMERRARGPKKSVSINENAEEITYSRRQVRRKRSITEGAASDPFQDDDPKPLRSILKVGSDLNRRSNSFAPR